MEHYWKLCPVEVVTGTTHTLVEVIHSSNREHRHNLKSDCVAGYYSYMWPLVIPDNEEIPDDFDELLKYYPNGDYAHGLFLKGKTFKQKDLLKVVEKIMSGLEEIAAIRLTDQSHMEVI